MDPVLICSPGLHIGLNFLPGVAMVDVRIPSFITKSPLVVVRLNGIETCRKVAYVVSKSLEQTAG